MIAAGGILRKKLSTMVPTFSRSSGGTTYCSPTDDFPTSSDNGTGGAEVGVVDGSGGSCGGREMGAISRAEVDGTGVGGMGGVNSVEGLT